MIVPPKVVPVIAPFTVKLVKPDRLAIVAFVVLIALEVRLPVKVRLFNPLRLVIVAFAALSVPAFTIPLTLKSVKVPT